MGDAHEVNEKDTHPVDATHMLDADDIANMNNMHEAPLLSLLKMRYMDNRIYTFTGDILISLNPYLTIDGMYDIPEDLPDYKTNPKPHVFCVADMAYRQMLDTADPTKKNQSMIVSGESGAGKTEACKYIMRYLASLSERYCASAARATDRRSSATVRVEQQVLSCNPFLEAMGNAKTVRNDNSSRFGKFLKIEYDKGRIIGARMEHYLLEKARVVAPSDGERNYHIFYQLLAGCTEAERTEMNLYPASAYHYLTAGGCTEIDHVDDNRDFQEVRTALHSVGVGDEIQADMWRVLAGILHLGNVEFQPKPGNADGDAEVATIENCTMAGNLLGADHMSSKLVNRMVNVQGRASCYVVNLTPHQAENARDALAKAVYEKLFGWVVMRANKALANNEKSSAFIGILDIFGFEIFELNSFEQLCINYANEKLQSLFNHHIFVMEMAQYKAEGIEIGTMTFADNKPCVELIEKKPFGILMMLDEVCVLGRDTDDEKLLQKMDQQHKGKHPFYGTAMLRARNFFSVKHFAGEVTYCVDNFIDKNNDTLYSDLKMLMQCSSRPFVCEIFREQPDPSAAGGAGKPKGRGRSGGRGRGGGRGGKKSVTTIASKFKTQLASLNETLLATTPHYVRCVKPNKVKASHNYDTEMVLTQLLYAGVLETVRIRREGYPFRETYPEFWRRATGAGYHKMVPELADTPLPPPADYSGEGGADRSLNPALIAECRRGSESLCRHFLDPELWRLGKTKIFMKPGALDIIFKAFRGVCATRISSWWKCYNGKWKYKRGRRALVKVQKGWRSYMMRKKFAAAEGAVTKVQANVRRRAAQKQYAVMRQERLDSATKLQATYRMSVQRRKYVKDREERQGSAAIVIQSRYKGHLQRCKDAKRKEMILRAQEQGVVRIQARQRGMMAKRHYEAQKKGAITAQRMWRGKQARKDLSLKKAAAIRLQTNIRGHLARRHFHEQRAAATKIQALVRGKHDREVFRRQKAAVQTIEDGWVRHATGNGLMDWTQELHAACAWGDFEEAEALLEMRRPELRRLRTVPMTERVRIRNRFDGMKTALHAAAVGGSIDIVRLLLDRGADPTARDLFGSTPLHNSAAIGDSALEVTKVIVERAPKGCNLAGVVNEGGQTPIDVAVGAAEEGAAMEDGSEGGFRLTVAYLIDASGGRSAADRGALLDRVAAAEEEGRRDSLLAGVEAAARREAEILERRKKERRSDPHYQFLYVAEQERKRQEEEAIRREEERRIEEARDAAALVTNRAGMEAADVESQAFNASDRAREAKERARRAREEAERAAQEERARELERKNAEAARLAAEEAERKQAADEIRARRLKKEREEQAARDARAKAKAEREARAAARAAAREAELDGDEVPPAVLELERKKQVPHIAPRGRRMSRRYSGDDTAPASPARAADSAANGGDAAASPGAPAAKAEVVTANGGPSEAKEQSSEAAEWEELTTPEGLVYFHNSRTQETQWTVPDVLKDIYKPSASSKPDTAAPPESKGAPPPAAAPKLNKAPAGKAPPAAVAEEDAAPAASEAASAMSVWSVHRNDDGLLYYYNRETETTTWDVPPGMEGVQPADSDSDSQTDSGDESGDDSDFEYEGTPWTRHTSEDGLFYYSNSDTGVTQWERPSELPEGASDLSDDGSDDDDAVVGRNGWVQHTNDDGLLYFHNEKTNVTQWERPAEF